MPFSPVPIWKEAPFIRLIIPFIAGIAVQWYCKWPMVIGFYGAVTTLTCIALFSLKNITARFQSYWAYGILLNCLLFFAGLLISLSRDNSHNTRCIRSAYTDTATGIIALLEEPLMEKPRSFKALASTQIIQPLKSPLAIECKIIIYLQKDSASSRLQYGNEIVFKRSLQPITNTGNPGGFDYKRYCALQQVYFQVYLKSHEYKILPTTRVNSFKKFLFDTRTKIVAILKDNIPGSKESGLAEALLIGYKQDLDKDLIQSYSNTGVVHVIAISGLHVGLIYWLLTQLLTPLRRHKKLQWLNPVLVIAGLWVFGLLAGGSPSVLRSAVMFSAIVLGESISRNISVYNSLAASALLLLCYNPFWLWDVGFQLSYAAVLSIVVFMKPIYNWWYIKNKIIDSVWKLNAVTLSAQVLTIPLCLYYFHQFPNFFLITNLIAVPLSSIILLGELFLCIAFAIPSLAELTGWMLYWLIRMMNTFIEYMDSLPFAVLENIQISFFQIICLYVIIVSLAMWLLKQSRQALTVALVGFVILGVSRLSERLVTNNQKRMIVYNVQHHHAIDFIEGYNYLFQGDSSLLSNEFLKNFHLKPSRIMQRIKPAGSLPSLVSHETYFHFAGKNIVILNRRLPKTFTTKKIFIDVLIVSGNPRISMADIKQVFGCRQIIFDSSNSTGRIKRWKIECDQLNIPCYSVPEKGAFVMNMN